MNKTIFRIEHTSEFTIIANKSLQDTELTWAATGLLSYLLSLPDDWTVNINDISKRKETSKYEVRKLLNELIRKGYVVKVVEREVGQIKQVIYKVLEIKYKKE